MYTIELTASIATITKETIFSALVEYIPTDFPQRDSNIEISDIAISDVLQKANIQTTTIGNRLVAGHPVHGSENGNNFVVSPEKNVWHCFRCNCIMTVLSV